MPKMRVGRLKGRPARMASARDAEGDSLLYSEDRSRVYLARAFSIKGREGDRAVVFVAIGLMDERRLTV